MYGYEYQARKIMFNRYIYSLLQYCSSIFYHRLALKMYCRHIRLLQRRWNIVITRAYCDILAETACLLAAKPLYTSPSSDVLWSGC